MAIIPIPTGLSFLRPVWTPSEAVQVNRAVFNNARRVLDMDNGFFQASVSIMPATTETVKRKWRAFAALLRGPANTFRLPTSDCDETTADLTVRTAAAAGVVSLAVTGTADQALKAGQYLTLIADTNVEQLVIMTADATLDGSAHGTVTFEPATRYAMGVSDVILAKRPTGLVALAQGTGQPDERDGLFIWSFEVEEDF